jgi:hypothetical protein
MANSSADYSALELQLGQALVEAVAPEEMEFFDAIAAAPKPSGKKRDHALGFGVPTGEDLGSISAALLVLCKPLLTFLWENAKDASGLLIKDLSEQARLALEKHLGEWFVRRFKRPRPVTISSDKVDELVAKLRNDAASLNLDEAALSRLTSTLRDGLQP